PQQAFQLDRDDLVLRAQAGEPLLTPARVERQEIVKGLAHALELLRRQGRTPSGGFSAYRPTKRTQGNSTTSRTGRTAGTEVMVRAETRAGPEAEGRNELPIPPPR